MSDNDVTQIDQLMESEPSMTQLLFGYPLVKISREHLTVKGFAGCKIVQHGGSFRMQTKELTVTLDPVDALWIIETFKLRVSMHPLLRRVCLWDDEQ